MGPNQMLAAGGDALLKYLETPNFKYDENSKLDYHYVRQAAHHQLYTVANSNAMNGAAPGSALTGIASDKKIRIIISVISLLGFIGFTFLNIKLWKSGKKVQVVSEETIS